MVGREQKKKRKQRGAVKRDSQVRTLPTIRLRYLLGMLVLGLMAWGSWQLRMNMGDHVMVFEDVSIDGEFINLAPDSVTAVVNANLGTAASSSAITQAGIFLGAGLGPLVIAAVLERWSFDAVWLVVAGALLAATAVVLAVGRATRPAAAP